MPEVATMKAAVPQFLIVFIGTPFDVHCYRPNDEPTVTMLSLLSQCGMTSGIATLAPRDSSCALELMIRR